MDKKWVQIRKINQVGQLKKNFLKFITKTRNEWEKYLEILTHALNLF